MSEGAIRVEPFDVLTRRDEQLAGMTDPDTEKRDRPRRCPSDEADELFIELADLTVERDDATGDRTEGELGGLLRLD